MCIWNTTSIFVDPYGKEVKIFTKTESLKREPNKDIEAIIGTMKILRAQDRESRIVFWFDN